MLQLELEKEKLENEEKLKRKENYLKLDNPLQKILDKFENFE